MDIETIVLALMLLFIGVVIALLVLLYVVL